MDRDDANLIIRVVFGSPGAELSRLVRHTVFVVEQAVPAELEWDGLNQLCVHGLAMDPQGRAIGTGRLLPSGRIGRMAVLAPWRRRGIGSRLLQALLREQRLRGWPPAHLHAQLTAADFYARQGFRCAGAPFDQAGIPHVMMRYQPGGADRT